MLVALDGLVYFTKATLTRVAFLCLNGGAWTLDTSKLMKA